MKATVSLMTIVAIGFCTAALLLGTSSARRLPIDAISAIKADSFTLDSNISYAFSHSSSSGDFSSSISRSSSPAPQSIINEAATPTLPTTSQDLQVSSTQDSSADQGQSVSSSSHQTIIQNDGSVSSSVSSSVSTSNGSSSSSSSHGYSSGFVTQNGQIIQQYFNNY